MHANTTRTMLDGNNNLHVLTYDRHGNLAYAHMFQFGTYARGERDHADLVEMVGNPCCWDLWDGNDMEDYNLDEEYFADMKEVSASELVTAYKFVVSFEEDWREAYGYRILGELLSVDEYSGTEHQERVVIRSFSADMTDEYERAVGSGEIFDEMVKEAAEFLGIDAHDIDFVFESEE